MKQILFALLVGAAAIPASASFAATAGERACIDTHRQSSWKAVDNKTLYISQSKDTVYKVDFAQGCPRMQSPFAKFISTQRGSSYICAPIDLDVKVYETPGFTVSCLATGLSKLTPAEIAALPKEAKP
jgi:hypothetical protein